MNTVSQIEADLLGLPAQERERLALLAWDSLAEDRAWLADPANDPEGIALAQQRDRELASNQVQTLTHEEFLRRRIAPAIEA